MTLKSLMAGAVIALGLAAGSASAATINLSTLVGTWDTQQNFSVLGSFFTDDYLADVAITAKFTDYFVWGDEYEVFVNGSSIGAALAPLPAAPFEADPETAYNSGLVTRGTVALNLGDTLAFKFTRIPDGYSDATIAVSAIGGRGGAVPEPATWAMMIAGFGLAGATLRRRRAILAA